MLKKIFKILSKKEKLTLIKLVIFMFISAFLDLVGISTILPIISLLSPTEADSTNLFINILRDWFSLTTNDELFVGSIIILIIFTLIKAGFGVFFVQQSNKFLSNFQKRLTNKLLNTYLSMPYEFHLQNNSSTLIGKSVYDVENFTNALSAILELTVYGLTIFAIFIYLMFVSFQITLIVAASIMIVTVIIACIIRPKIRKISSNIHDLNLNNYKYLYQAFNGIKETKISNTEGYFAGIHSKNIEKSLSLTVKNNVLLSIPTQMAECFCLLGLALALAIIKLGIKMPDTQIIQIFTVFTYGIIKLLPLVVRFTKANNSLVKFKISIDTIYKDIDLINKASNEGDINVDSEILPFTDAIHIQNLSFSYSGNASDNVLKNVSFEIKKNSKVAICGKSGSGKTTLIDNILGLLSPTDGQILVDGININQNIRGWRKNISYIPQTIFLVDDTIRNNVVFGLENPNINDEDIWKALRMAELEEFVKSLKDGLNTIVGEHGVRLSGGQRQRIGIARAFYRNTNIIVFDEATSSLDYETEKQILDHISQLSLDKTLIIITHRLNTIDSCDKIYQIQESKLVQTK